MTVKQLAKSVGLLVRESAYPTEFVVLDRHEHELYRADDEAHVEAFLLGFTACLAWER